MRRLVKNLISAAVDTYASLAHFYFPDKYTWRWKLDMLTAKYEPETTALFKRTVKPGMTVIDIGAHIGYFARLTAKRAGESGRVFAFEADSENRELLIKNTARYPWVHINDAAIAGVDGEISFYHLEKSTGCHTTIPTNESSRKITVPAITLDTFFKKNHIDSVDLIKMDIEGGEINALQGMATLLQKKPKLVIEYNPSALARSGASEEALFDILTQYNYSISAITPAGLIPLKAPLSVSAGALLSTDNSVNIFCS